MSVFGVACLVFAFAACVIALICLGIGHLINAKGSVDIAARLLFAGRISSLAVAFGLTVCCGILIWCFFSGDTSLAYVVENRSDASGSLSWLYTLSGLWAGRSGSLLFWAWLISVFGSIIVISTRKDARSIDAGALAVTQMVLAAFLLLLLFSGDNMPFMPLEDKYKNADGTLNASASVLGMNALLEHWAMAIHPPTLFIGYAGLTIPFAYAVAALVVDDDSAIWVQRSTPYLMVSWLALTIGIGLGAVWAYIVLGWGGYWGWDPVENASLLPWLICVALAHSFTVYRTRGGLKKWSVFCACLAFAFVILGTFITRSGVVQSVHAFGGDSVSVVLFLGLIVVALAAGSIGLFIRRSTFGVTDNDDDFDSFASRDAAYYVNNLIMVIMACVLAYMTLAPALPSFLPLGGQAVTAGTYNTLARPFTLIYCLLMAACPMLGWRRTSGKSFWKMALVPCILAIVIFAVLLYYFLSYLLPSYDAILAQGGTQAEGLLEQGAPWFYNGIAVIGFAVASLLFFNSLFTLIRAFKRKTPGFRSRLSAIGGAASHAAIGIILIGLIGSSMYVTEKTVYLPYDEASNSVDGTVGIQDFDLVFTGSSIEPSQNGDITYSVSFDVFRRETSQPAAEGQNVGHVDPSVQLVTSTQQQKLTASVLSFPLEDLFVVYRGVSVNNALSLDIKVNPLISFVWVGFGLLIAGSSIALFARRGSSDAKPAVSKGE